MSSKSIVVVDSSRSLGVDLRERLAASEDKAHVFSNFTSALEMIGRKKIDAVLVEFDTDKETTAFCDAVHSFGIPIVFAPTPISRLDAREYGFVASFPHLPNMPKLPVQYAMY